jgi:two-component system phosphate regulon sensor histidine kinase PhoR
MLYVAVPLKDATSPIAVARVALPLTEVDRTLGALRGVLGVAVALALILAVLMSSFAAHLASRTVRRLTEAAQQMARGDLGIRTRVGGEDEYGALGRALDSLAESLSVSLRKMSSERDRLNGILSGMQDGVLLIDGEGRVLLQNPALSEMLLLSPEALDKPYEQVISDERLKRFLGRARNSTEPVTAELDVSGLKARQLVVRAAALDGPDGGAFAVFVDVTNTRRLESMRRDFVANVSHELRTPVTAIRSAAETLLISGSRDAAMASNFLAMIERNAERLQQLVEDLLDLSRIESQKYQITYSELDLEGLFSHAVSLLGERAESHDVRLSYESPTGISPVLADERALERVLTNLVDNAIKYAGKGARVTLRAREGAGGVQLVVEDTGPGIDAVHLPRLFERFYRVDSSRSRELGGTGLGLSIVKHLVESMGGSVSVESELGRGTTFTITLRRPGVGSAAE